MHHESFDLTYWQQIFPDESFADESFDALLDSIRGPRDVCLSEYFRKKAKSQFELGRQVPADIFVFALGEPEDRSVTKIGGIPYRPANLPWPRYYFPADDGPFTWWGRQSKQVRLDLEELPECLWEESWDNRDDFEADAIKSCGSIEAFLNDEYPKLRFLAQFNFADSHDLVGSLPGDILLLFAFDAEPLSPIAHYYEWHPLGLTDLITADAHFRQAGLAR